jgi:hypothetical protein
VPNGWQWAENWRILSGAKANQSGTDEQGWMYAWNWAGVCGCSVRGCCVCGVRVCGVRRASALVWLVLCVALGGCICVSGLAVSYIYVCIHAAKETTLY